MTQTDLIKNIKQDDQDILIKQSAMERMTTKEEIANAVLFLATEQSSFINGQVIRIDGGSK